jgi:hypothetical protein
VQVGSAPLMVGESAKARFFAIAPVLADFRGLPPESGFLRRATAVIPSTLTRCHGIDDASHCAHLAKFHARQPR